MMRYAKYFAEACPIVIGLVEGTCGSMAKDRADKNSARWSRKEVRAVLDQRAAVKRGEWDDYRDFCMASEHKSLYGNPERRLKAF